MNRHDMKCWLVVVALQPLPPCPRAPVVGGVALRLRLPAEQALWSVATPMGAHMISSRVADETLACARLAVVPGPRISVHAVHGVHSVHLIRHPDHFKTPVISLFTP